MIERLRAMLVKEFIQVVRDPRMRFLIFIVPAFQTILFGYAVNTDVRDIKIAVHDQDNSPRSRELTARFAESGYFRVLENVHREERVRELLDRGKIKAVLRMRHGFAESINSGHSAVLQVILDGTDSNTAGIVLNYAGRVTGTYGDQLMLERTTALSNVPLPTAGVELMNRAWYNENLESRNFYVPAVIANIVFILTILLSSMAVVREKEVGTMEQIIVTPISSSEFIMGKTIPFAIIGFIDVSIITLVAVYWFQVPIRGSITLLFASTGLFLMSSLGFGLLISTISRTQQQAMLSAFFFIFPAMLLSGFAFPIENMPEPIQWLTLVNPVRYYLVLIRDIFLKGAGVATLWPHLAALALLGSLILTTAVARFRKTQS